MQSVCTAVYYHMRPVRLHHIFPHYIVNGTIFRGKLLYTITLFAFYVPTLVGELLSADGVVHRIKYGLGYFLFTN